MKAVNDKYLVRFYFFVLILLWTATVGTSMWWSLKTAEDHILTTALAQSRMAMAKDVMYRRWVSSKGGFYMPTKVITPNPYLNHIKTRDITTTDGKKFTLINPAYMTRLVYEFSRDETHVRTRLVSQKLLNPINKPVGWEVRALEHIMKGEPEYYEFDISQKDKRFNYMAPFIAEKSCLKCHGFQGYKVGDIRGGVSVSSNISDIVAGERHVQKTTAAGYVTLWAVVIALMTIGYLNLLKMLAQMNENQKELKNMNSQNESILKTAFEGIFGTDNLGRITFVNQSILLNTGYTQDDLIGKSHILLSHHRDEHDNPIDDADCSVMTCIKTMRHQNTVETFHRKNGSTFTADVFIAPVVNEGILTGTVVSYYDITEKMQREQEIKAALSEKSMLLNELNHRVKNNLQIISGILSLQVETASEQDKGSAELLKNAQSRVMSMALLHETLYKSQDLDTADITGYITKLTEYYNSAFGTTAQNLRYVTDVDPIQLSIPRVITCGMLMNEVITNSIKHAFKNTEQPVIHITLKKDGDNAVLTISDNGAGFDIASVEKGDSLGMMLIHSLSEQLYGTLTIENINGTVTRLVFPVDV